MSHDVPDLAYGDAPDAFDSPDGRTCSGPVSAATPGRAERERFAAKMEMLADWFDADDFAKGRAGRTEVQEDLRRWAAAARDLAAQDARPAPDGADVLDITGEVLTAAVEGKRILLQLGSKPEPKPAPELAELRDQLAGAERVADSRREDYERVTAKMVSYRGELQNAIRVMMLSRDTADAALAIRERTGLLPKTTEPKAAPKPAPELAAAVRVAETVLDLLDDFTHAVIDYRGTSPAITAAAVSVRRKAGLPPVEGK